jgi:hypothetical protein
MTSPVRSREERLYTPAEPDDLVCKPESPDEAITTDAAPPSPARPPGPDYVTVSVGAGAIIGADVAVTLDRFGHLYLGAGAGVGLSATVASVSVHGGHVLDLTTGASAEKKLGEFLEGDAVEVTGSLGAEVGIASSPGGTATESGVGLAQISAQFQHNWRVLDLPIRW